MKKEVRLNVKVGDRVRYINDGDSIADKEAGLVPPIDTWGDVVDIQGPLVKVEWDKGTTPAFSWVGHPDIALLTYKKGKKKKWA